MDTNMEARAGASAAAAAAPMRRIEHPGPASAPRTTAVDGRLDRLDVMLPAGASLLDTLERLLASHGATSAVAEIGGGRFEPFAYVMPAEAPDAEHAVYFSERHAPGGAARLEAGTVTVGRRDGRPWLHCHAVWRHDDGSRHCGHLLPNEAVVAAPIAARVALLRGIGFEVTPDAETRFTLFQPVPAGVDAATPGAVPAFALRVAPNEDICTALENACASRGVRAARVHGGVGSLVGARFEDGREVDPFITEVFVRRGTVATAADGSLRAALDIGMVDYRGGLHEGRLRRGANPVLVTFEVVLEPLEGPEASEGPDASDR